MSKNPGATTLLHASVDHQHATADGNDGLAEPPGPPSNRLGSDPLPTGKWERRTKRRGIGDPDDVQNRPRRRQALLDPGGALMPNTSIGPMSEGRQFVARRCAPVAESAVCAECVASARRKVAGGAKHKLTSASSSDVPWACRAVDDLGDSAQTASTTLVGLTHHPSPDNITFAAAAANPACTGTPRT